MRSDALVAFIPIGAPLSLANLGAGVTIATNPLDLLGLGVGGRVDPAQLAPGALRPAGHRLRRRARTRASS